MKLFLKSINNMKYSSELKIGITGLISLVVIIWGINYLKGRNILKNNYMLIARYEQVDGLEASANILLNGFKIGSVDEILFDTEKEIPFTVSIEIEKKYRLRKGSIAEIYSADLLGSRAIRIIQSQSEGYYRDGDTIESKISGDMIGSLLGDISPLIDNVNSTISTLDSVAIGLNSIIRDPQIRQLINDLVGVGSSLNDKFSSSGDFTRTLSNLEEITNTIKTQEAAVRNTIHNLESISQQVNNANLDSLINSLASVGADLSGISSSINSGNGTIGKLLNEDSIYMQISHLVRGLDSLVNDVNDNPKKYVSFSLIGK